MAYSDGRQYTKYLKNKCLESTLPGDLPTSGCSDCGDSNGSCDDCGCCPVGLVAVYDENNQHIACLSPDDAEQYNTNNTKCQPGFVKLYKNTPTPAVFLGCVSESEYAALYATVNPS